MKAFWTRWRIQIIVALVGITILVLSGISQSRLFSGPDLQLSEVAHQVKAGEVDRILVALDEFTIKYRSASRPDATSRKENSATLSEQLIAFGVTPEQLSSIKLEIVRPFDWQDFIASSSLVITTTVVFGFFWFVFRQTQSGGGNAFNFGRSRARMRNSSGQHPTVTFADVAGADEAKHELVEVVEFLREPSKFVQLGARIPKGVLLIGAPGTGKTLLAKAVSGEAGVPFFSISGSEFVEMFVGVGASRVRDLFDQAKRQSPCIIFVDEIDAVGRSRGSGLGGGHDEREQTLNQILVEMDGFDTDTNIIVVAATNRPDILDAALMRPGRFDRRVMLDRPDLKGREQILKVHTRGKPIGVDVDLNTIAKGTPGFAGADLENLVNEAAIMAARRNRRSIAMTDFNESIERVMMGPERKSRIITEKEKRITAYHEAGHAIIGHLLPNCDPIHKVTIIARGLAGGYTWSLPDEERRLMSRSKFIDDLAMTLGGRAAEEIVFGDVTTGASGDLQRVTEVARDMVTRYGMSDKMGPMMYGQKQEMVFLGRDLGEQRDYSETVALEIDREVQQLVNTAHEQALEVLRANRAIMDAVAQRLFEVETIESADFAKFFKPGELPRDPGITTGTPFNPRPKTPLQPNPSDQPSVGGLPAPLPA